MKTSFLDTEVEHWRAKSKAASNEGDAKRREILEEFAEYREIFADKIRLEINEPPRYESTKKMMEDTIENKPVTKLDRFKRWVRETGVALGGITVMLGTLVTAIVSLLKSGVTAAKKAVESTMDFLKKFARLAKKLDHVLGKIVSATY